MKRTDALKRIRRVLLNRRVGLNKSLELQRGTLIKRETVGDSADAALDTVQSEISSQLLTAESRELIRIDEALERMREGSYGTCELCDRKIPLTRLQAIPYATRCVSCQRAAERTRGAQEHVEKEMTTFGMKIRNSLN